MHKMEDIQETHTVLCKTANFPPTARQPAIRIQHPKSDEVGWIGSKL